jgi:RNA polymerase sigma-70 factor (ECF subfamily)
MLAAVNGRARRYAHGRVNEECDALDTARRSRYAAQLRRWALERLPAGTKAAFDAAEWIRETLGRAADPGTGSVPCDGSLLVRLRAAVLADDAMPALRSECARPSSRVEQLVGRDRLDAWEQALDRLSASQRELAILRIEFGLDYEEIAAETGFPVAAARAHTVNALAALIDALGPSAGTLRAA